MRYIFGVENYQSEKSEAAVIADSYDEAVQRLSDYHISKGELHYYWLIGTDNGTAEKPYIKHKARQAMAYAVALVFAYMGADVVSQYGIKNEPIKAIHDETVQRLLKEV